MLQNNSGKLRCNHLIAVDVVTVFKAEQFSFSLPGGAFQATPLTEITFQHIATAEIKALHVL